jgi:hypothetical protein
MARAEIVTLIIREIPGARLSGDRAVDPPFHHSVRLGIFKALKADESRPALPPVAVVGMVDNVATNSSDQTVELA